MRLVNQNCSPRTQIPVENSGPDVELLARHMCKPQSAVGAGVFYSTPRRACMTRRRSAASCRCATAAPHRCWAGRCSASRSTSSATIWSTPAASALARSPTPRSPASGWRAISTTWRWSTARPRRSSSTTGPRARAAPCSTGRSVPASGCGSSSRASPCRTLHREPERQAARRMLEPS